jgi:N-acetylmuramoyl-L-alanine amidase
VAVRSRVRDEFLVLLILLVLTGTSTTTPSHGRTPADPEPGAESETLVLSSEARIRVRSGRDIELEVRPAPGTAWESLATRFTGSASRATALAAWNGDRSPSQLEWVRIPLAIVEGQYRALVLRNLFPRDRYDGKVWVHVVREGAVPTYGEGMWQVALWFTGRGDLFTDLTEINGLATAELRRGQEVRIPDELLHPALRDGRTSADGSLVYGSDDRGPYAGYRLRPGEALYSAVVVRFTGRTKAEDVVGLAETLAERSDIPDLTDIPVGYLVKIPFDYLEPEFLPARHPKRLEAEAARKEMAAALAARPVPRAQGLDGVLVIIDPGHGGRDLGTMNNGIWEHDYVYDVACRLKEILERQSAADVFMTLVDEKTGCTPSEDSQLKVNRQGTIQTHPPFLAREKGEAKIGVNLRWFLANSAYRKAVRDGTDGDRVVFISIHADARHPSLRGTMVYVPGAKYRRSTYSRTTPTYTKYAEVREKPTVRFSHKSRIRSEAVSTELAEALLDGFRAEKLTVPKEKPIRNRIVRSRRKSFVPAVLGGNEVPAKVLVEVANMTNPKDAKVLATSDGRERMARALARGLFGYFGEKTPGSLASR